MPLTTIKYRVYKQSFIKKNSQVMIKPGEYRLSDYPQSVWDYLTALPGVCERIEINEEVKIGLDNKQNSKQSNYSINLKFQKENEPGVSLELEKQNSRTKPKRKYQRKTKQGD